MFVIKYLGRVPVRGWPLRRLAFALGIWVAGTAVLVAGCAPRAVGSIWPERKHLELIGAYVLPAQQGSRKSDDHVGGLSGAWYDHTEHSLMVVTDDATRPRVIPIEVHLSPQLRLVPRTPQPLERPAAGRSFDMEGIAPAPDGGLFVASEGEASNPEDQLPGVYEYTREGRLVRRLPLPAAYAGLRPDQGLEGLSASPDRRWLFIATESSLRQDGKAADFVSGALSRILVVDLARRGTPREYAYQTDAVPSLLDGASDGVTGNNGVSEVLSIGPDEALMLERAFVQRRGASPRSANTIRIYRVRLQPEAEVTGRWSLKDEPPGAVLTKTLVLDLASIAAQLPERLRNLENFEAMTFGPTLPDGSRSLLLISDDNFGDDQVTAMIVFSLGLP